jgi:hypothetical protein
VRDFKLGIDDINVELGQAEVAALAQCLGKGVELLTLSHCTLTAGFWAALEQALPSLHTLALLEQVRCRAAQVVNFCKKRVSAGGFVLRLSPGLYKRCGGEGFKQDLRTQGLSHISVRMQGM